MHQRDYVLRLIEQFGAALAELRRRILGGEDATEIRESLAGSAHQMGLDLDVLRTLDVGTLAFFAAPSGELDVTRCWMMAELLYLDGLEALLSGRGGKESLTKARALYDMIRPAGGMLVGLTEASERIREIDRRLEAADDPGAAGKARRRRVRAAVPASLRPGAGRHCAP